MKLYKFDTMEELNNHLAQLSEDNFYIKSVKVIRGCPKCNTPYEYYVLADVNKPKYDYNRR